MLQPIGFDIELKQLEAAAVTDALNNGEYEVAISNNCWATGDPNYQIRRTLGSDSVLQGTQHGSYNNPEVDALLDQAQVELDPQTQIDLYNQAQAIGVEEVAIAPLFDQQTIIAYKPWVRGLSQRIAYAPTLETIVSGRSRLVDELQRWRRPRDAASHGPHVRRNEWRSNQMSGLRDYLGDKRAAILRSDARLQNGERARPLRCSCRRMSRPKDAAACAVFAFAIIRFWRIPVPTLPDSISGRPRRSCSSACSAPV